MIELLLEAERALSFGRVDRAEQLYRQVADADPHSSIAVVGLGRVALERGDDLGAYLLARRALTIDPENEAARRLAARLEEVLATRGDPVADPMPRSPMAAAGSVASPPVSTGVADQGSTPGAVSMRPPGSGPGSAQPHADSPAAPPSAAAPPRKRSLVDRLRGR